MRIALLTDIHGNREALEACLAHAADHGAERYVFLGDYVGYGADPGFVVDVVADFAARGATALRGNHDAAVLGNGRERMNPIAAFAIAWTSDRLGTVQRDFLARLPLMHRESDRLFVHASARRPEDWDYITDTEVAAQCFGATDARLTLCGHVHVPMLYELTPAGLRADFDPRDRIAIPLSRERWIAVIGAVGQPRDGNPAACYAMLDDARETLTFFRVAYDIEKAARKIRNAGLPPWLAARLYAGQ